jgi:hypothetical protein
MARFIAAIHERYNMPEVITGEFTSDQVANLDKGATDNYVDIINNAWGQQLGIRLKEKYGITRNTNWTPQLLTDYLNDIQGYCAWAFDIGFRPFRPTDEQVVKFSSKLNKVMHKAPEVEVRRST